MGKKFRKEITEFPLPFVQFYNLSASQSNDRNDLFPSIISYSRKSFKFDARFNLYAKLYCARLESVMERRGNN